MKFLANSTKIFKTPLGIALAVMQWIVILFAYLGDQPEPSGFHKSTTYLLYYLAKINFIALRVSELITYLVSSVTEIDDFSIFVTAAIFCITLQWVSIGRLVELLIENTRKDSVNILK